MNQPAFEVLRRDAQGPFVILCDHASHHIPVELNGLGLDAANLARHIAWDIGAAGVARELASLVDSTAILCCTSRLVIDCNRHPGAADLIPEISDGTTIPGNHGLSQQDRQSRIDRWFTPYHDAIEAVLATRVKPFVLSIHSMTPVLAGIPRPWQISLSSHTDRSFVDPLLAALRRPADITVGDNQPYDLDPTFDYSVPLHAMRRHLPYLQVEFRQDEIADAKGQAAWAQRLAAALPAVSEFFS
ncbi:MAG: N-formylglutamate amidohydrolase [Acidobacteriota bacterium]|nr:N-formylglutamate amidohydrolase [Acidobacteriota bacterium]